MCKRKRNELCKKSAFMMLPDELPACGGIGAVQFGQNLNVFPGGFVHSSLHLLHFIFAPPPLVCNDIAFLACCLFPFSGLVSWLKTAARYSTR